MGQHMPGARQVEPDQHIDKGRHILAVFIEADHMAHVAAVLRAVRQALPAPVDGGHRVTRRREIRGDAAVFLDVFGAARQHDHRALGAARPDTDAQPGAIGRLRPDGAPALGPFGHIGKKRGVGKGFGHARPRQLSAEPSFIAVPMSPSSLSLPDIKAAVGFRSPDRIS